MSALPEDLGPDLTGLIEAARHVRAGCPEEAALAQLEVPWSDPAQPAAAFHPLSPGPRRSNNSSTSSAPVVGREPLRDRVVDLVAREGRALGEGGRPIAQAHAASRGIAPKRSRR